MCVCVCVCVCVRCMLACVRVCVHGTTIMILQVPVYTSSDIFGVTVSAAYDSRYVMYWVGILIPYINTQDRSIVF